MNFKRSIVNTSILSATLLASVSAMASTAFSSLPGTRANAMGGAYIAIANDTSSMFYNPAGIALIDGAEVMVEFGDIIRQDTSTLGSFYATHTGQPVIEEQELKLELILILAYLMRQVCILCPVKFLKVLETLTTL
jgi:long-subunit fatty acid transport protein